MVDTQCFLPASLNLEALTLVRILTLLPASASFPRIPSAGSGGDRVSQWVSSCLPETRGETVISHVPCVVRTWLKATGKWIS